MSTRAPGSAGAVRARRGSGGDSQAARARPAQPAPRRRVPAAERRQALIAAAVHEFAQGGLRGTPVDRIARRVGVVQPYVFSLFGSKRELFLAAIEHCFSHVAGIFRNAAAAYEQGLAPEGCEDALMAMGMAYKEMLVGDRDYLMLQLQSYAACEEDAVRTVVRRRYAELIALAGELSGASAERLDDFFRQGMALNVAAAMGVMELCAEASWVHAELAGEAPAGERRPGGRAPAPAQRPGAEVSRRARAAGGGRR